MAKHQHSSLKPKLLLQSNPGRIKTTTTKGLALSLILKTGDMRLKMKVKNKLGQPVLTLHLMKVNPPPEILQSHPQQDLIHLQMVTPTLTPLRTTGLIPIFILGQHQFLTPMASMECFVRHLPIQVQSPCLQHPLSMDPSPTTRTASRPWASSGKPPTTCK